MLTTKRGGSFANVGFTNGLFSPYLERLFVGLHTCYAFGQIITSAVDLLRKRILIWTNAMYKKCFKVLKS